MDLQECGRAEATQAIHASEHFVEDDGEAGPRVGICWRRGGAEDVTALTDDLHKAVLEERISV